MKAKELMNPRFEIIGDFPYNDLGHVGDVIESNYLLLKNYPNLFRPLNWWERRKEEDMPSKLICKCVPDDDSIIHIESWDMKNLIGWINKEKRTGANLDTFKPEYGYFPID